MPIVFIFFAILIVCVIGYLSHQAEKKRREAFREFANRRGWSYTHERDYNFDDAFRSLPFVGQGNRRFLQHRMQGEHEGGRVWIGEYHYEVTTRNGKTSTTHHYYSTLVMLNPRYVLKDLSIRREGLFDKMKAAFGWDDIDFASAEFSRTFHVSAPDRDWAFAVIQPHTMELMLRSRNVEFHMRNGWLVVRTKGSMKLEELTDLIRTGEAVLEGIPEFVKEGGR